MSLQREALAEKLAKAISEFCQQLSSSRSGSLAQIWMPEVDGDGSVELHTQGLPYSINGVGDLLALFRCISCKYKFSTDITKTHQMGAVGRVFTSGEPEMSGHVQRYDQHVYLRAAEAQRCRVHSTLFMPIYASPQRSSCLAVFEVVLTDQDVNFAGMVGWIISCLQSEGLYTAEVDTSSIQQQRMGLRTIGPNDYDGASALESGAGGAREARGGAAAALRLTLADDGGSQRHQAIAAVVPAGSSLDILTAAAGGVGQAGLRQEGETAGLGDVQAQEHSGEAAVGTKRPRAAEGNSSGRPGGSGENGGPPRMQRKLSGAVGLPSPAPQQQQSIAGVDGSASGGASGLAAAAAAALQQQQQHALRRLSGSLEDFPPLPIPLTNGLNGATHLSGSGGLPSANTGQGSQPADVAPMVPLVAAAVQQLLNSGSPNPLAALLAGQSMQPAMPQPLPQPMPSHFGSAGGGGSSGGMPLMNGPSPAGTASLRHQQGAAEAAQRQQQQLQQQQQQEEEEQEQEEEEESEEEHAFLRPTPGAAQKYGQGNRVLTYDDLAAQFGYGLKEAANRLNICPTTLKRACRRLGIPRWPRRELVKHKRQKHTARFEPGPANGQQQQQQQQQQQNQQQQQHQQGGSAHVGNGSLAKGPGFSTGSGPSSGGSGNPDLVMAAAAAMAAAVSQQQQQHHHPQQQQQDLSSIVDHLRGMEQHLLRMPMNGGNGMQGQSKAEDHHLKGLEHLLAMPPNGHGGGGGGGGGGLLPGMAAALQSISAGMSQQQQGPRPASSAPLLVSNPALVGQVMQLLQQSQQQQQQSLGWQPQMQAGRGQHSGLHGVLGHSTLPPPLPLHVGGIGGGQQAPHRPASVPPAPLLSNLGLPRRADSKLQSVGHGMGSLDILAAADLDVSVGNMSVGNSPRIALSNLGGLSQLGLSGFEFGGGAGAGGGGGPAATATATGGGATGPHNDPAFSTGAMPPRLTDK